jgi:hypothetical protein
MAVTQTRGSALPDEPDPFPQPAPGGSIRSVPVQLPGQDDRRASQALHAIGPKVVRLVIMTLLAVAHRAWMRPGKLTCFIGSRKSHSIFRLQCKTILGKSLPVVAR